MRRDDHLFEPLFAALRAQEHDDSAERPEARGGRARWVALGVVGILVLWFLLV